MRQKNVPTKNSSKTRQTCDKIAAKSGTNASRRTMRQNCGKKQISNAFEKRVITADCGTFFCEESPKIDYLGRI
jgi:hypothetical protein